MDTKIDAIVDAIGLRCPQPIILTKQKMVQLPVGSVLLVVVTDPSFAIDCQVYARQSGNQLLQSWQEGNIFKYLLVKK